MHEETHNDSLVILRAALGIIFFAHGSQKLLGWFGGYGFDATIQFFQQQLGIPPALAAISILVEFFGGILLLLGLLTRAAALLIAINMAVALISVHLSQGFFIAGEKVGFEYVFALLLMSLYLAINGAGRLSVDRLIRGKAGTGVLGKLLS
ncbi:MAG: DoxX family protein [Candidatus Methanoperedens sp.]|nr:DoxX family protein [Candidatus Methanoperedens sp.]